MRIQNTLAMNILLLACMWTTAYSAVPTGEYTVTMQSTLPPVLLWEDCGLDRILTWEWNHSTENEIGLSGTVLGMTHIGDPAEMILDETNLTRFSNAVQAGAPLGITTFGYRVNMGSGTSYFSSQSWTNTTDWTNAINSIHAVGQLMQATGIKVVVLDVEDYGVTNYMFRSFSAGSYAYNRGAEIASILRSYCSDVIIMLIPEYGTGAFWSGYNISYEPAGSMYNRFRNGMMSIEPHVKVYVGTEATYGCGGEINDRQAALRVEGITQYYNTPASYKAAIINYLQTAGSDLRAKSDDPAVWDAYGGLAPGFWILGTNPNRSGKQSAYATPDFFAAQMEAFMTINPPLIWEFCSRFPWARWTNYELEQAGMIPYDGHPSEDYWQSWYAIQPVNPFLDAYRAVLKARGTPAQPVYYQLAGDMNRDSYVDLTDLCLFAAQWLEEAPPAAP